MERRKETKLKSNPLPVDYLNMVIDIFQNHFDACIKEIKTKKPDVFLSAFGSVSADEVHLGISLLEPKVLSAITVHASSDFDPAASTPKAEELLGRCVDALGQILAKLIDPEKPKNALDVYNTSITMRDDIPLLWVPIKIDKRDIFVKVDTINPVLDNLTEKWLKQNDPEIRSEIGKEQEETAELFVTGPGKSKKDN